MSYTRLVFPCSLEYAERRLIEKTMQHFNGDRNRVALALQISTKTLYNKLKSYE